MKESYTAADMASAAAQGFRDGMKHAADICDEVYMSEDGPEDRIALDCQTKIIKEIAGDDE